MSDLYAIDLDWCQQNNRSFTVLAQSRMCPACQEKIKAESVVRTPMELLDTIKDCCSKAEDFITPQLPIRETIFRIFLTNGNEPISLAELSEQVSQLRSTTHNPSLEILHRLLTSDRYYGLHLLPQEDAD